MICISIARSFFHSSTEEIVKETITGTAMIEGG